MSGIRLQYNNSPWNPTNPTMFVYAARVGIIKYIIDNYYLPTIGGNRGIRLKQREINGACLI